MGDKLTRLVVEQLGALLPRNQVIEHVCLAGHLRWPEAELLVTLVEAERAHVIARRQGPWLIAISVVLIVVGMLPYGIALYVMALLSGLAPAPGPLTSTDVEITLPIVSPAGLVESIRGTLGLIAVSLALLPSGIIGLYDTVRRYRDT